MIYVTVEQLHDAIEKAVRERFPDFATVEFYRDDQGERIPTPACLMEMTDCERSDEVSDGGTGMMGSLLRFEARVIMQVRDRDVALELRKAAVSFAAWLHQLGRFPGAHTDAIQVIGAEPDDWMPAHGGFRAWRIEWVVPALLGADAWADPDGVVPRDAFYSIVPDVGIPHEPDYRPLGGSER